MSKGLVLRVEGNTAVGKENDRKEARVYLDETTTLTGKAIGPGGRIEARVNEKNHAMVVFSAQ
ncbi:MAG: hypothetical protein ACREJN_00335 [Nitrospiraceae bacterium]